VVIDAHDMKKIVHLSVLLFVVFACKPYSYTVTAKDGETKEILIEGAKVMLYNRDSELVSTKYTDSTGTVVFDNIMDRKIYFDVIKNGLVANDGWWPTRGFKKEEGSTYYLYKKQNDTTTVD
jgi:hypothetical protein